MNDVVPFEAAPTAVTASAPSSGSTVSFASTLNVVAPESSATVRESSFATAAPSSTQVTVTETVAVSPPLTVYENVSGVAEQKFAFGVYVTPVVVNDVVPFEAVPTAMTTSVLSSGSAVSFASTLNVDAPESSATVRASSFATAAPSSTQVTMAETVALEPPFNVYWNVSAVAEQKFASGVYVRPAPPPVMVDRAVRGIGRRLDRLRAGIDIGVVARAR